MKAFTILVGALLGTLIGAVAGAITPTTYLATSGGEVMELGAVLGALGLLIGAMAGLWVTNRRRPRDRV